MCRLLAIVSRAPIDADHHLDEFARICATSPEYQGHGWGYAVLRGGTWDRYRSLAPIWDDNHRPKGEVHVLIAHARSAFRNEDIAIENNMPFIASDQAFVFNGELHGVRLPLEGRTGAHKIFRFIRNLQRTGTASAIMHAMSVIRRRASHIRACNFILADSQTVHVHSLFSSAPDYFTLYRHRTPGQLVICSAPYPAGDGTWIPLANGSTEEFACSL
jgi:predicted glutamine amidotransferase